MRASNIWAGAARSLSIYGLTLRWSMGGLLKITWFGWRKGCPKLVRACGLLLLANDSVKALARKLPRPPDT